MRRRVAPVWFQVLCAIGMAIAWRLHAPTDPHPPAVQLAFWPIFGAVASWIWSAVQVAATVSVHTLHVIVGWLLVAVRYLGTGLWSIGKDLTKGLLHAWQFLRTTYDTILKPAWLKFWRVVDWAKRTLDDFFRPIFRFLRHLRDELLKFYDRWVRPILDSIGIARKVLSVFRALGLEWAKKLDAKLASLEEQIDRPFRLLLAKINEVLNFVNRIATANGLFQRLALVRSIERDIRYVSRAFTNWRSRPLVAADYDTIRQRINERTLADVKRDTIEALETGGGRYGPFIDEMSAQWRIYLTGP